MKLTPRRDEIKAVVDLLESDGYDNAEAMAKDVIKRVAEVLGERDWYAWAQRDKPGGLILTWGPFSSETEATKFGKKVALGGESIVVKMCSSTRMLDAVEEATKPVIRDCTTCGHPVGLHEHPKHMGGCALDWCTCQQLTK